ncbi:hypothetical protein AAW51_4211 [Caldimonas brevitalea]|uniref:Uncharacterized protein n=1 Tax=Caldimonas brevitalea TaxID=413882 RepID=A0A0G3BNC5_9BURK|nr:hypothetical protein AAW51_4211 [Caldimonas brevitalea]
MTIARDCSHGDAGDLHRMGLVATAVLTHAPERLLAHRVTGATVLVSSLS